MAREIRLSFSDPTQDCICILNDICTCNEKQVKLSAKDAVAQIQAIYDEQGKTQGTINPKG